jgi:hypothetical protein
MATANVVQTSISGGHSNALAIQGDGAFLPKLDTASRIALTLGTPDKGLMVYDTTLTTICVWSGNAWEFISDNSNGVVSVKDFGAKGDGVTNDTAAIQAAIDYGAGNIIFFPAGDYILSGPLTISSGATTLTGVYSGDSPNGGSILYQTLVNSNTIEVAPASAATQFIASVLIENIGIKYTNAAAFTQTSGTAIKFTRVTKGCIDKVRIVDAFTAIEVLGGFDNVISNVRGYAGVIDRVNYPPAGYNGIVRIGSSSYGGVYQGNQVTTIVDCVFSQAKVRNYTLMIESADGLEVSGCYISGGVESTLLIRPKVSNTGVSDSDYISAASFVNTYFDGVTTTPTVTTGSKNSVVVDDNIASTHSRIYGFVFGSGCFFGNTQFDAVTISALKVSRTKATFSGCTFENCLGVELYLLGGGTLDAVVSGCQFTASFDATFGSLRCNTVRSLSLTGNVFHPAATGVLHCSGTNVSATITGNVNVSPYPDFIAAGTWSAGMSYSGNQTSYTGAANWTGTKSKNQTNSDTDVLDWYKELTATPSISFSGGSTGITYGTRLTTYTRVGNTVQFSSQLTLTSKGTSTGALFFFPGIIYPSSATSPLTPLSVRVNALAVGVGSAFVMSTIAPSSTAAQLYYLSAGSQVVIDDTHLTNTSTIIISGTIFVD